MKVIPRDSKILSISHNDFDGAVSQIVLGNIYKNITYIPTSFYRVDSVLENLNFDEYDYVFLTDIHPEKRENINLSDKIVLIDHHKSALDYHNPQKMRYVISSEKTDKVKRCAALLVKKFVEAMYNIKLTHLDNLVYLTNDYDCWILHNGKSKLMNDVMFYLYRPKKFIETFMNGRTRFTEQEIEWLKMRRLKFEELYNEIEIFELDVVNGCVIMAEEFINEIADKLRKEKGYKIVFIMNPKSKRVSVRHGIESLDMGEILKEKGWGGGHEESAGFFLDKNIGYEKDLNYKVSVLEEIIHTNYKDCM